MLYALDSLVIVTVLYALLLAASEAGYRVGKRGGFDVSDSVRGQVGTVQAALLGLLALLLGFTFSLSLQRHDVRAAAVVTEANAIGTALLRAGLLPQAVRAASHDALVDYLVVRLDGGRIDLAHGDERVAAARAVSDHHARLWRLAIEASAIDPRPVTSGLYVQALNDVFDTYGARQAALDRHVPEVVLLLLFSTFVLTAWVVGYASGIAGHRVALANFALITLIAVLVFVIIDLDRPRRGLITVPQQSMQGLLEAARASGPPPPAPH